MQPIHKLVEVLQDRGSKRLPLERLYRHVCREDLLIAAYAKIGGNDGSSTPGVDGETVDGMSLDKVRRIAQVLRSGDWVWKPVRRVHIPKKSGGTRPLGIPSWGDRLVQQAIKSVLEPYFDPQFSKYSFGFRPGLGCHHALREVTTWRGTKWFIEGDISKCFDTVDHAVLMQTLGEKLHDDRLLKLIRTMLAAGYLEDWRYGTTYSGTPQGGICSPLLANIYLDRLDQFVEQELAPDYNRGKARTACPEYARISAQIRRHRDGMSGEEYQRLVHLRRSLPSRDTSDPAFRRLRYVRYADDFLLGFIGPRSEAEEIRVRIRDFLGDTLKLRLSEEKTLITHASEDRARFLGYEIAVRRSDAKLGPAVNGGTRRSVNGIVGLFVPRTVVTTRLDRYVRKGKPAPVTALVGLSDYHVVSHYQAIFRGLVNYYRMAHDVSKRLNRVRRVLGISMVKTLANKHKCSCASLWRKHQTKLPTAEGPMSAFVVRVHLDGGRERTASFGGIPLKRQAFTPLADRGVVFWNITSDLGERLHAKECQVCGATGVSIELHHIRRLADLKRRTDLPEWKRVMQMLGRKTLAVCEACHQAIHDGKHDGPPLS